VTAGRVIVLALVGLVVGAGVAAAAPTAEIHVKPNRAYRGEVVRVFGTVAGGCATGDQVTLISKAFSGTHEFAGVPAIFARSRSDGSFSKRTRVPGTRKPGRYSISGRCGGGNLGVQARLRILSARHCGNHTFDNITFKAIHARILTCSAAKQLLGRVAAARAGCPAHWRCVYPATGRVTWSRGRKRISFVPG
jgi:hypothetical protein